MNGILAIIPVAAVAYVATNLDNFVLLVSLLARYRGRPTAVIGGYLVCMTVLGGVGFLIGEAANNAPVEYLGFLGLIPMSIGLVGIARQLSGQARTRREATTDARSGRGAFATTLFSQIGNGADTIVTFGVLFADSLDSADFLIVFTMGAMAGLFVFVAIYAVGHPRVSGLIERYADRITPFILLFVGGYVLFNTGTDLMPD
jgi:cadmium resistance protein CadD (predicted permease)